MNFIWGIGMLIASYAIQVLLMPKQQPPDRATLDDFDFPQVEDGTPQGVVFGDVWIESWHVLWYGNLRTSDVKSSGGKK